VAVGLARQHAVVYCPAVLTGQLPAVRQTGGASCMQAHSLKPDMLDAITGCTYGTACTTHLDAPEQQATTSCAAVLQCMWHTTVLHVSSLLQHPHPANFTTSLHLCSAPSWRKHYSCNSTHVHSMPAQRWPLPTHTPPKPTPHHNSDSFHTATLEGYRVEL
jgi:hypothetical protein